MTSPKDLALESKPIALAWIDAALREEDGELLRAALSTNFSVRDEGTNILEAITETLHATRAVIVRSDRFFLSVTEEAAGRFFAENIPPAYAIYGEAVYFTPRFGDFGPMCRAAMVVHESVHVIDPDSGAPNVHISEWDEPGFSRQTVEESLHNPSSYASFCAQIHERKIAWPRDVRFGAGRPKE